MYRSRYSRAAIIALVGMHAVSTNTELRQARSPSPHRTGDAHRPLIHL